MNSIKCKNCGLSNFAEVDECRRCGTPFFYSQQSGLNKSSDKRPRRYTIVSLAIFAAVAVAAYYLFLGMAESVNNVNTNDAYRVGTQPPQKPQPAGLSRTEHDRQHSGQVGNALKENPSFAAQRQHNEETNRIMQQASNTSQH